MIILQIGIFQMLPGGQLMDIFGHIKQILYLTNWICQLCKKHEGKQLQPVQVEGKVK